MRPPRLLLLLFCFIFLPILLTCLSVFSADDSADDTSLAGRTSRLRAFFSFNAPSSLFPPSAVISLTDDNSTFFLARPAAFGPLLPDVGLSGQLWVGNGFGEDSLRNGGVTADLEGELGCSDIPGWKGKDSQPKQDKTATKDSGKGTSATTTESNSGSLLSPRNDLAQESKWPRDGSNENPPSADDGTDDYLHHPLPDSDLPSSSSSENGSEKSKPSTHADIQSLQESAEISGKVVLLSRGGCGFLEKVKWVQRRGGVALIVGDHTRGGSLVTMYARGDTSNVTIPAVFTSHTTAHLLSSLIPARSKGASDGGHKISEGTVKGAVGKGKSGKQGSRMATSIIAASTPTSSSVSANNRPLTESNSKLGFLQALVSFLGFGSDTSYGWHLPEDSRRPPSSGNIDWILVNDWEEEEITGKAKSADSKDRGKSTQQNQPKKPDAVSKSDNIDGDGFVIGVQDWRDPDLIPPNTTPLPIPTRGSKETDSKSPGNDDHDIGKKSKTGSNLKGGSITPGSGEYSSPDKSTDVRKGSESSNSGLSNARGGDAKPMASHEGKSWLSSFFGWLLDPQTEASNAESAPEDTRESQKVEATSKVIGSTGGAAGRPEGDSDRREGLWVTLTPTNMSTSPFFDTLLVLVVSPLITLTVVYALLLLRSRIRRRRWRAPKSVVARLPVRTYHTMPSHSSTSSSPRSPSPGSSSPTSPLLVSHPPNVSGRSRPRSQTTSSILNTAEIPKEVKGSCPEKSGPGSTLWRRKYTGRQIECVVCLEEYIDGQSRVMSLPCGHEFHAECITPWLTTRRRTCPICKGDVVRSMSHIGSGSHGWRDQNDQRAHGTHSPVLDSHNNPTSIMVPMSGREEGGLDPEQGDDVGPSLLRRNAFSAPQSNWRHLAYLSFYALSGDAIWHQARDDRNR